MQVWATAACLRSIYDFYLLRLDFDESLRTIDEGDHDTFTIRGVAVDMTYFAIKARVFEADESDLGSFSGHAHDAMLLSSMVGCIS